LPGRDPAARGKEMLGRFGRLAAQYVMTSVSAIKIKKKLMASALFACGMIAPFSG
jgi:hypothetical protein